MPARSPRPPRAPRLARLPLLLAYLLVLLGTPVGEAGFLWMHLTTAHSSPAEPDADSDGSQLGREVALASAAEHEADALPAHEHAATHAHERSAAQEHEHAPAREHEHGPEHQHADARTPEHHRPITSAASEPERRSVAPDQPHEHGGRVHTHRQHPAPDAVLLIDALSRFYLAPPTTTAPYRSADAPQAPRILPAPQQVAARIDTPPPRLPG